MSLENLCTRNALLNFGTTAVICAVSSRLAPHSQTALLKQAAVSLTMALAKPLLTQQVKVNDETYSFGSLVVIGSVGALCGLSWKVNAAVSVLFAFGSYIYRLSSIESTKSPEAAVDPSQSENLDHLAQDVGGDGSFCNTGMTAALVDGWTFNHAPTEDVLEFLDGVIAYFKSQPSQLRRVLCRPNNAEESFTSEQACAGIPRNTPLMLLVKMGGEKASEAVRKILPYYDEKALFLTTPNGNTPLHIAVVTGQFEVAMALMKRAQELGQLDAFLACKNSVDNTADALIQNLFLGRDYISREVWEVCDRFLGGEEANKAQVNHDRRPIHRIRNAFFEAAKTRLNGLNLGIEKISSLKNYTLKQFLEDSKPSETTNSR